MRISIDPGRCEGHGRCYSIEPDLFAPKDDFGRSEVSGGEVHSDDPALVTRMQRVAEACPERAITVETETGRADRE